MTNEQPTDYAALLNELWSTPGRDEWEPKNHHGYPLIIMQLGHLTLTLPGYMTWCDKDGQPYWQEFAYRLMKSHAEEWLRINDFTTDTYLDGSSVYIHWFLCPVRHLDGVINDYEHFISLADALAYAHQLGGGES